MLAAITDLVIVAQVQTFQQAEVLVCAQSANVVIIDQADDVSDQTTRNEAIAHLMSLSGVHVITVSLGTGDMWIYRQKRVVEASAEDLVAALMD